MSRKMLIDVAHEEETRIAILSGNLLNEFDFEITAKKPSRGNIYLAKVVRVEPSLQAAFVDYGGERHGFLSFTEIHPDYFRIPIADREKLLAEHEADEAVSHNKETSPEEEEENSEETESVDEFARSPTLSAHRKYKIQEVIKRRQILLVQAVKEQRGNKGAALTTYLSLAGRYCVFMPNNGQGGGISRKIGNGTDRRRLRTIVSELEISPGIAVIVRTAGAKRNKTEIKRDYEYLLRLWEDIRQKTLVSTAPCLVHEEGDLIRRSIRDLYANDIDEVIVEGEAGYRTAKDFMRTLIPSHAKRVRLYKNDQQIPLFQEYKVEDQIMSIHEQTVPLRSGGYLVIHSTEALVAIDVNSGRSIRERHIEETALRTNLEAAEAVAQQLRLRDLAGLIVIDFIDMEEQRNNTMVERKLQEEMRRDRARLQLGRISSFGLLELSRQRMRPSVIETTSAVCEYCQGLGVRRSTVSLAMELLRMIEKLAVGKESPHILANTTADVAFYVLNRKREHLYAMEQCYNIRIEIQGCGALYGHDQNVAWVKDGEPVEKVQGEEIAAREKQDGSQEPVGETEPSAANEEGKRVRKRSRRGRGGRRRSTEDMNVASPVAETKEESSQDKTPADTTPSRSKPRRRRRRRPEETTITTPPLAGAGGRRDAGGEEERPLVAARSPEPEGYLVAPPPLENEKPRRGWWNRLRSTSG